MTSDSEPCQHVNV